MSRIEKTLRLALHPQTNEAEAQAAFAAARRMIACGGDVPSGSLDDFVRERTSDVEASLSLTFAPIGIMTIPVLVNALHDIAENHRIRLHTRLTDEKTHGTYPRYVALDITAYGDANGLAVLERGTRNLVGSVNAYFAARDDVLRERVKKTARPTSSRPSSRSAEGARAYANAASSVDEARKDDRRDVPTNGESVLVGSWRAFRSAISRFSSKAAG